MAKGVNLFMGSFSWYTSDTGRAILLHKPLRVYALQPDGEPLVEKEYDGLGEFGGHDIYDLVADWNRKYLSEHPEFLILDGPSEWCEELNTYLHTEPKRADSYVWYSAYADLTKSREEVEREVRQQENWSTFNYRRIGIDIACHDECNVMLPYPIKLVQKPVPYGEAKPSMNDPEQGFGREIRFYKRHVSVDDLIAYATERFQRVQNTASYGKTVEALIDDAEQRFAGERIKDKVERELF